MPLHALQRRKSSELSLRAERGLGLGRVALSAAWAAGRGEAFSVAINPPPPDRIWYATTDGWEAPLHRYPAPPGSPGEPLVLAHGLGVGSRGFDLAEKASLARTLQSHGFEVYLLSHRGDAEARAPASQVAFDFDDIVEQDVPAAIDRIREANGAPRLLWLGHALGGQLAYAHLARGGAADLAAVATLCAPVSFDVPRSHARLASLAALMVPEGWRIPSRQVLRALSPTVDPQFGGLCCEVGGPELRAWMVHCGEDLPAGLVRQVARWLLSGTLCDRHDRLDYVAGMEGVRASLLALVAGEDPLCPAEAARPAVAAMLTAGDARLWDLGPGWSHLDVLIGKRAETEVHQPLARWFSERRGGCWTDTGLGSKGR